VPPAILARVSTSREELIDGLRAVTYLLHHLAPIFLLCVVRDLGSWMGDTTPATPDAVATRDSARRRLLEAEQFKPTIYLYDSHAGASVWRSGSSRCCPICARPCHLAGLSLPVGLPSAVGPVNEVDVAPRTWRRLRALEIWGSGRPQTCLLDMGVPGAPPGAPAQPAPQSVGGSGRPSNGPRLRALTGSEPGAP
jgi:hypothetical protein